MILPGSYANGFAPRDGQPLYPQLWRGCVGAWAPCLGPTGLTLRDLSGKASHGTLANMDPSTDWSVQSGKYGLDFDGSNDYVDLGLILGTRSQFTLSVWFQKTGSTRAYLLGRNTSGAGSQGVGFELYETVAYINYFGSNPVTDYAQFNWNSTGYHHWCLVFDGNQTTNGNKAKVYVDGVSQSLTFAGAVPATVTSDASLKLARRDWSVSHSLCQSDDVRVYERPLNDEEVQTLALRRGIAYELAPRRRSSVSVPGFRAAWVPRQRLIIGGGL